MKRLLICITVCMALTLTACNKNDNKNDNQNNISNETHEYELTEEGIIKPEIAKQIIEDTADKTIKSISSKDFQTLSQLTHPVKGVRFTPYTQVSVDNDVVLNTEEIKNFFNDEEIYIWGSYDGSGMEIELSKTDYYEKFIYTADFINPEEIGYNVVLSSGNMTENQFEVYENSIVVEYYFSGFNPDFGGADWQSLRLVFEEYENEWKLVGIIHNQWTI